MAEAEKMAPLKPLLEQGMPIKGVVILLVDGKPVQRAVGFVMGQETRIDLADDGSYIVTPTLNPDGKVRYEIGLLARGLGEQVKLLPTITTPPWGRFTLSGAGRVIAFDPDMSGPLRTAP